MSFNSPTTVAAVVEHPGVIEDYAVGLSTLGGERALSQFLRQKDRKRPLALSFRPQDPFAKCLPSRHFPTADLLLKITVRRRVGRRRKDASHITPARPTATSLVKSKQFHRIVADEGSRATWSLLGIINDRYRFRDIPDFQSATTGHDLAANICRHFLTLDYDGLKSIDPSITHGNSGSTSIAFPPSVGQVNLPFNYGYLQNPSVRNIITDEGFVKAVNQQPILKHHIIYLDADAPDIPSKYPATLKEVNELDDPLIEAIQRLRVILDERPVATRRVIGNKFPLNLTGRLRLAYPYVGYTFRKGPWRDTLIRYGVDPRTNPDHRFYQTLFFRIGNLEQKKDEVSDFTLLLPGTVRTEPTGQCSPEAENSHVYDGRVLHRDGKVWQVCDIVDPVLKEILETDKLRSECDALTDGWYMNGTLAKVRAIMRDELDALSVGEVPVSHVYRRVVDLIPDNITEVTFQSFSSGKGTPEELSSKELALVRTIRGLAKANTTQAPCVSGNP